ncbi:MAG: hypothetical protein J6V11_04960, partial [Alphaproteobacteria bacterium]|nr:hypothetical protein [Alphaproteobacteria bacterium]
SLKELANQNKKDAIMINKPASGVSEPTQVKETTKASGAKKETAKKETVKKEPSKSVVKKSTDKTLTKSTTKTTKKK